MQTFDVSLDNTQLWEGCEIEEVAGRKNVTTHMQEAINKIGKNAKAMLDPIADDTIVLTGAAPVWAYLTVFHQAVHRFSNVYYNDGRGGEAKVAKHSH